MSAGDDGTRLELGRDGSGTRHFIGDVPIHAGDPIAAKIEGKWFDGRYEARWVRGQIQAAFFYFVDRFGNETCCLLTADIPVRLTEGQRFSP